VHWLSWFVQQCSRQPAVGTLGTTDRLMAAMQRLQVVELEVLVARAA
jgi:hypothetical protein